MALRAADAVLVDSCFTEDELRRLFHLVVPVKVAYMGVPTEFLDAIATYATSHAEPPRRVEARDGTPIDLNRPYVVSVGTINRRKNYAKLCEAFSRAPLKDVSLLLIGELGNSARQLFRQVQRSGAGGRISLLGRLSNADLVKLMSGARALAAPSLYEGFGLPILESFALGIPVCAARASCFPEVAGDAAAYFDGNSADSIAECIAAVVDDLPRAGVLADLGRLRVRDFSWQAFAASHVDLYTSVLASRS
jgi:alpha-1,3-rhamnosyl/mannosyltransferase